MSTSRSTVPAWLVVLLVLPLGSCDRPPADRPDLILISLDTLRADHLGCYGSVRDTSPNLDALAADGVLFERALSPAPWTLPSHVSMLTGRYPGRHGVRTDGHALGDDVPTLADWLAARGYATHAIVNNAYLSPRFGLDRGFDEYHQVPETHAAKGAASTITEGALRRLREQESEGAGRRRPLFLFLHYNDIHSDYRSRPEHERRFVERPGRYDGSTTQLLEAATEQREILPEDAEHLARLYDAGIRQLDEDLEPLWSFLAEEGRLERTVVALTSDHGEEFLEHGGVLHGATLYDEVLHVPWLLRGAGVPRGVRSPHPVSLVDLAPTLLGLLRIEVPPGLDGVDLRDGWGRAAAQRPLFAEATSTREHPDRKKAVWRGRHKFILDLPLDYRELYDVVDDPREQRNLVEERTGVAEPLLAEIARFLQRKHVAPPAPAPTDEQRERLRALGYL